MEDQELLDSQFFFESTSEAPSEPEQQPDHGHDGDDEAMEAGNRRRISENDEATAGAMNDLALRTRPPKNEKALSMPHVNTSSETLDAQHYSVNEAPTTRLRKRKSPELPDKDALPKKKTPPESKVAKEPNHVEPEPVSAQLSRPANPLNPRKLQDRRQTAKNKDKFDFLEDPTPQVPAKKANQANGKLRKARGRPRKETAQNVSSERLRNADSPAVAPRPSKSPSGQASVRAESGPRKPVSSFEGVQDHSHEQSESPGTHKSNPRRQRPNTRPSPPAHQQFPVSSRSPRKALRLTRSPVAAVKGNTSPEQPRNRSERHARPVGEQERIESELDSDVFSGPESIRGSTGGRDDHSDHDHRMDESSDDESSYRNPSRVVSRRHDKGKTAGQPDADAFEELDSEVGSSGDEDGIDYEDNEQEDFYEDDEPSFELFGGVMYWRQIMDGAKRVGTSNVRGKKILKKPRIMTTKVQELLVLIGRIKSLYEDISIPPQPNESPPDDREDMGILLDDLGTVLDGLKEVKVPQNDRSQSFLIQDIYAHAIPNMVFMLRAALRCRSHEYSQPEDTENLTEMLCIQDQIIKLCEKARNWKTNTLTTRPIKGAVANKILPYMRSLSKQSFEQELDTRINVREHSLFVEHFGESHRKFLEKQQRQKEENRRKIIENLKSFNHPFPERPELSDRSSQQRTQPTEIPRSQHRSQSATQNRWTREQNEDLVRELLSENTRYLPAQERYLSILNTPSLQNKLPEHIRERALFYKDVMIQAEGPRDYLESIE